MITRYATSVAIIADKGNEQTPQHTNDTGNRGRRVGWTDLAVKSDQISLSETREIPYVDSIIEMAGNMTIEGGRSAPEEVESMKSSLAMDSGDKCRFCFEYRHHDVQMPLFGPEKARICRYESSELRPFHPDKT